MLNKMIGDIAQVNLHAKKSGHWDDRIECDSWKGTHAQIHRRLHALAHKFWYCSTNNKSARKMPTEWELQ